jgi:hypothetical protein
MSPSAVAHVSMMIDVTSLCMTTPSIVRCGKTGRVMTEIAELLTRMLDDSSTKEDLIEQFACIWQSVISRYLTHVEHDEEVVARYLTVERSDTLGPVFGKKIVKMARIFEMEPTMDSFLPLVISLNVCMINRRISMEAVYNKIVRRAEHTIGGAQKIRSMN